MKISITEQDRQFAFRTAIINIARLYEVQHPDYKSNFELYEELELLECKLWNTLNEYFIAYNNWFEFYQNLQEIDVKSDKKIITEYSLSTEQKSELLELIKNRQEKLEKLEKEYQIEKKEKYK